MWLGRKADIPFGRLPRVLPTMQKTFPKLCHFLLQVVPQGDLQPPPKVYIPPSQPVGLEGTGVSALGACASPPALTPSPHYDLSYSSNSGCLNPDLLLGESSVTKPGSTVGSALDHQSSSPGFDPCLGHHSSILQNLDSWPLGQLSVSSPPVPLGLGPLGQDTEGCAFIYIPPPPLSHAAATLQPATSSATAQTASAEPPGGSRGYSAGSAREGKYTNV